MPTAPRLPHRLRHRLSGSPARTDPAISTHTHPKPCSRRRSDADMPQTRRHKDTSAIMTAGNSATVAEQRPVLLFVFGMGRSGSSALTRVLSLCGGGLPDELVGATEHNALGHWEPQQALSINNAFLARHGSTWFDPSLRLQGELCVDEQVGRGFLEQITDFLRALPAVPIRVVKDPRITALSAFWFQAASQLGYSIRVVIPVRHPQEVVASLATRDGASTELASALWLKYNLLAERNSRPFQRVFVEYPNLLRDWRVEVGRISTALSIDLAVRDEQAIDAFLRPDLRHERGEGQITEVFDRPWLATVYAALSAAACDDPVDGSAMDEIFESYRASERAFRVALEDFSIRDGSAGKPIRSSTINRGERNPHITRLIYAVAGQESSLLKACLNSAWYLRQNPDVVATGMDPCAHWLVYGINEGRMPCDDPLSLLQSLMQARLGNPANQ